MSFIYNLNLRVKVTLGVVLPLLLILGIFAGVEYARHREMLLANLSLLASHAGQVVESNLRRQMLESDFDGIQALLDQIGAREEFRIVYLLDTSGHVIFAPNGQGVGLQLDNRQPECQACHQFAPAQRPPSVVVTAADGQRVFRSMRPIENSPPCSRCHEPEERLIGLLLTDISIAPLEAPLATHLREGILWWVGTILVTVVVVNLALDRFVLRRLEGLAAAIARFGQEQLPPPPAQDDSDEVGQLAAAFHTMAEKVAARSAENQALSERLHRQSIGRGQLLKRLITAQEDERKRVARELHDDLGQVLGGLALRLEAIERLAASDPEQALAQLGQAQALVTYGTNQMYDLILALRPSSLDDLGLVAALRSHAQRTVDGTGVAVQFNTSGLNGRLPPEVETVLYRIFQEALNNVVRHANASNVYVSLTQHDHTLVGAIRDDGRGFDPESVHTSTDNHRGFGLLGMQERVVQCGGRLEIIAHRGKGTQVTVHIPLPETNDEQ